jgi:hypothetical protein
VLRPFWAFPRLYEVRQLSWRPAQVNWRHFFARASEELQDIRPGQYDQDTSMAGRYGAEVYIRGTVVPFHHSAYTIGGGPHLQTYREETPPTRLEEEQTVVMSCRLNSKMTPFTDVCLICVLYLCSLLLYAQILIFLVSSRHILIF